MSRLVPFKPVQKMWKRLSSRTRSTIFLGVPIFCTLAIFAAWTTTRILTQNANGWVDHTERVILESNQALLKITRLESRIRKNAIANQSDNLDSYRQEADTVFEHAKKVYGLVQDNPEQQRLWQQVQQLIAQRLGHLDNFLIRLQTATGKTDRAVALTPTLEEGAAIMTELQDTLNVFQDEERRLLAARRQRLERIVNNSTFVGWSLLIGSLLSSLGAVYLFWIQDLRRSEQDSQLDQSQRLTMAIASSVVDGVIILDASGRVEDFNDSALSMFGYASHEVRERSLNDFLKTTPLRHPDSSTESEPKPKIFQTYGFHKTGATFPVEASYSQVRLNRQQLLIVRDITQRKRSQRRLENYTHELEQVNLALITSNEALSARNQELDQFSYVASHDLKAPLRAISSLSEWIEEDLGDKLPPENQHQFHLLRSRVWRMEALINGITTYAQIGRAVQTQEPVAVEDVLATLGKQIVLPQFTLEIQSPMPVLHAHRYYVEQVFQHLIDNAIKFHHQQSGTIQIQCFEQGDFWEFTVTDDGPGIDPAYHQKIFEVFQTLHPRDEFESTGIGLAIVAKILATVGGNITVESALGKGSTFRLTWPK